MITQSVLKTRRLVLRPFGKDDIDKVAEMAGDRAVYDTTLNIPHPYSRNDAETWIASHPESLKNDRIVTYAITIKKSGNLIGAIGLVLKLAHDSAEMGYWIGKPYWNRGYATEAAVRMIQYGFDELKLNRIDAHYFVRNGASGKVMKKAGMKYEGCLRQAVKKEGNYEDLEAFAILRSEYEDSLVK